MCLLICECNGKVYADKVSLSRHQNTNLHKNNYIARLLKERENDSMKTDISFIKSELILLKDSIGVLSKELMSFKRDT